MSADESPVGDPDAELDDLELDPGVLTSDAMKLVLEELTSVYAEDDAMIEVRFDPGGTSCIGIDGEWVQLNTWLPIEVDPDVTGPNILRVIDDILAHEMGHYNWSDLSSKKAFSELYPKWSDVAANVANILEDEYVDAERMRTWYGMRTKRAYRVWLVMQTEAFTPPVNVIEEKTGINAALLSALHQLALSGGVKGIEEASDEIQEFCTRVRPVVNRVRHQRDSDQRFKLFHVVMQVMLAYLDEDDDSGSSYPGESTVSGAKVPDSDHSSGIDEVLSDDLKEEIEEMIDEVTVEIDEDADADDEIDASGDGDVDVEASETDEDGDEETAMSSMDGDDEGAEDVDEAVREMQNPLHNPDGDQEFATGEAEEIDVDEIERIDDRERRRFARLLNRLQEYGSDVERRKRERDIRAEECDDVRYAYAGDVRSEAESTGVIRDLERGFRKLVSRPTPRPSRTGTRVDVENVVRRAAGDLTTTALMEEEVVVETGDRCVGIASDISGSMASDMTELKIAGAALAKATEIIGDEFIWEAFTTGGRWCDDEGKDLRIVTAPDEPFDWDHLNSFGPRRDEPTASGIRDCRMLMEQTDAREYIMIVMTDGCALVCEDGSMPSDDTPVVQAREAVNECRADGYEVIGLGFGGMDERSMEKTFGGDGYRLTTIDQLATDVLELYRQQLSTTRSR